MLSNEKWFGASADFYPVTIDQSARFNDDDNAYLNDTSPQSGNRRTFTISFWFKRSTLGTYQSVYSAGTVGNYFTNIYFYTNDVLYIQDYASSVQYNLVTTQVFRDTTNWYHMVIAFDTTQATASDRIKLYVNGSQVTSFSTETYPSQNHDTFANSNITNNNISIGAYSNNLSASTFRFDGYLAEYNLIDGTALTPSSFGETKNGVWIPKAISGLTYGTSGFRLTFADSSNLGDDTSGNGNDFTSSGLASTDVVLDSPTNNFAVLNAIEPSGATLSEGNLRFTGKTGVGAGYYATRATFGITSGKWYFEGLATDDDSIVGIGTASASLDNYLGGDAHGYGYAGFNGQKQNNNSGSSYGATFGNGDIIGVAFDADNGTLTFYKNGATQGTAFTSLTATPYFPMVGETAQSSPITTHLNFGADSSFSGNKTSGSANATDGKHGDFYYTPPSGYLALCSANLPDTTISPNQSTQADDHFNTVLYSGNGSNSHQITGVGFQSDWVWLKPRSDADNHVLFDSSRGPLKSLHSNLSNSESTDSNALTSFDSDGFTLNDWNNINENSQTYVAWNWRCGGSSPTKTYKVVVVSDSGNKYRFRNSADSATFAQSAVTLDLQEGGTYVFDWSDSTAQGHPIRFSTTSDGTHGSGSEYTTGVVKDDSAYKTTITVAGSAPTLYYYCQNHSGMGGQVNTNTIHGSTNFDGSILSVSQTNETAGFSIATYTGSASGTVGHGLSQAPDIIIVKSRTVTNPWVIYTSITGKDNYLILNTTAGSASTSNYWGTSGVTSSVFGIYSNSAYANVSGDLVAYCFHNIEGFSKIGSYTGNGSTDGAFVYTGFRPAWVMFKSTSSGRHWVIKDSARDTFNVANKTLLANINSNEDTTSSFDVDFLSNGFKCRATTHTNGSNETHVYMAFAEQPFKFSNSR